MTITHTFTTLNYSGFAPHTHVDPDARAAGFAAVGELARRQGAALFELRAALDDFELRAGRRARACSRTPSDADRQRHAGRRAAQGGARSPGRDVQLTRLRLRPGTWAPGCAQGIPNIPISSSGSPRANHASNRVAAVEAP